MTKYYKKPPTFDALQFDGTEESADLIMGLARSYDHYAILDTWGNSFYIEVFRETYYVDKKNSKRVVVAPNDWFVINSKGKYWVYSNEDFLDEYGIVDE